MSNVSAGAIMTLVVPLSLLMVILGIWAIGYRRALQRRRTGAGTPES